MSTPQPATARTRLLESLNRCVRQIERLPPPPVQGSLTRMVGLALEAVGCQAAIGDSCDVTTADGATIEAEVVGFSGERVYLMPTGDPHGLGPNARVVRVIDGAAQPLDGLGPLNCEETVRLTGAPMNPLLRQPISQSLDVGVRTINSLLTVGRGQRIGLFAGSGVGKSVLLGMMSRYTSADVIVVGLIGERGREVKEFVDRILGPRGSQACGGGGRTRRYPAADATAWRVARDRGCRVFPRSRPERAVDHGLTDPLRSGAARDRPGDR